MDSTGYNLTSHLEDKQKFAASDQKHYILFERFPGSLNFVAGPIFAYLTILLNITVFVALFSKKLLTPATVLMQGLALADSLTALCMYGFEPLFYHAYKWMATGNTDPSNDNTTSETADLVTLSYPYCVIHYYLGHLSETFHLVSILLTASLGLQKVVAILLPVWSRTGMTAWKSVVVCIACFIVSICLHIPRMFMVILKRKKGNCNLVEDRSWLQPYVLIEYPMVASVTLGIAGIGMMSATLIIIGKFCIGKGKFGKSGLSAHEKRSSVLVIAVLLIFMVTETPRFYLNKSVFSSFQSISMNEDVIWDQIRLETEKQVNTSYCFQTVELSNIFKVSKLAVSFKVVLRRGKILPQCRVGKGSLLEKVENDIKYNFREKQALFLENLKHKMNKDISDSIIKKVQIFWESQVKGAISTINKEIKKECWNEEIYDTMEEVVQNFGNCWSVLAQELDNNLLPMILAMSPYSEQINYLIATDMTEITINLKDLKLMLEIMKLFTIAGCLSNFIIYIALSEKLRNEVRNKLCVCKTEETVTFTSNLPVRRVDITTSQL